MIVVPTRRNVLMLIILLSAILVIVAGGALAIGGVHLSLGELWSGLLGTDSHSEASIIVRQIRLPRVILAALVGAALAVSGTVLQALLRNPLADPYVLGISSGAALGAIVALYIGGRLAAASPLMAFGERSQRLPGFISWGAGADALQVTLFFSQESLRPLFSRR